MRLDQWLWAVRVFKTRTISAEAIKNGWVTVESRPGKPAHETHPGEIVSIRLQQGATAWTRTLKVLATPASRVGAKLVSQFAEELTPPEEFAKRRRPEPNLLPPGFRTQGSGRPTKRERRALDEFGE